MQAAKSAPMHPSLCILCSRVHTLNRVPCPKLVCALFLLTVPHCASCSEDQEGQNTGGFLGKLQTLGSSVVGGIGGSWHGSRHGNSGSGSKKCGLLELSGCEHATAWVTADSILQSKICCEVGSG